MNSINTKTFSKKISWQIGSWFVILAVLPLAVSAIIIHYNNNKQIVRDVTRHLSEILHEKADYVEQYVAENKQIVVTLAEVPVVVQALQRTSRHFVEHGVTPDAWPDLLGEALPFLHGTQQRFGYHDIFMLNRDGDIIFSVAQEDDLGTNIRQGAYRENGLALGFNKAMNTLSCEISPFIYYQPSGKSAGFIVSPVSVGSEVIGAFAIQLNEDRLFYIFGSYLGLGETGEFVAGRKLPDGSTVAANPLRHRQRILEKGMAVSAEIAIPMADAIQGHRGVSLATDYRGRKVVMAWDFLPSLNWGIVVKVDQDEALRHLNQQNLLIIGLLMCVLVSVLVVSTLFVTKRIAAPIKNLTKTVNEFTNGNLKVRAQVVNANEMGLLAMTFNEMAQDIESYQLSMPKEQNEIQTKIKELENAKMRLEKSELKNATILERSIEGFWVVNRLGTILEVNKSFCDMLGYSRAEILGMNIDDIEVDESPEETKGHIEKVLQKGYDRFETRHRHKSGAIVNVEISSNFDSSIGDLFFCFQRDITERKKVEEELHLRAQIIANLSEGVYLIQENNGLIVFTNPKFENMFGYDPGEMIGQHVTMVNAPGDKSAEDTAKEIMAIFDKTGAWQGEVQNIKKDGTIFWCYARVHRFKHSLHGNVLVSVHSDITAHKFALEEQVKLEKQLRQAQKMQSLGTLAGGIAHEFNNFLGIIILNTEMLLDRAQASDSEQRQLGRILKAGHQAKKIINQILSFSRSTNQKKIPTRLPQLIFEVMNFLESSLPSTIKICKKIHTEEFVVLVDSDEVHQILINLCTNAAHAMPELGTLTISLEIISIAGTGMHALNLKKGRYAKLSVSDTGVGMNAKTIELAFDPFFTTKEVGKGTGMGLALVYGIMESYEGTVCIESELGKGTTVQLFFPIIEQKN